MTAGGRPTGGPKIQSSIILALQLRPGIRLDAYIERRLNEESACIEALYQETFPFGWPGRQSGELSQAAWNRERLPGHKMKRPLGYAQATIASAPTRPSLRTSFRLSLPTFLRCLLSTSSLFDAFVNADLFARFTFLATFDFLGAFATFAAVLTAPLTGREVLSIVALVTRFATDFTAPSARAPAAAPTSSANCSVIGFLGPSLFGSSYMGLV